MTDLDELERLNKAATAGPWDVVIDDSGDRPVIVPSIQAPDHLDYAIVHWDGFWQEYWQSCNGDIRKFNANAALIVAMRNALPELIAAARQVERLRAALKKCRAQFEFYVESHLAKSPPDIDKAATNRAFAEICGAALSPEGDPK